jgi:glycine/serine hydroxymethyltransferase
MEGQRVILGVGLVVCVIIAGASAFLLARGTDEVDEEAAPMIDPLLQDEGHDHRNASQHVLYTENIQPVSYNTLTDTVNAEIQVADSPDGHTYAYIAGWTELHIVDVTDPSNTSVTGVYYDPNTQVFDVKYLEYNSR